MKNNKIALSGWLLAAVMAVMMVASGFQTTGAKFGVVDMARVLSDSQTGKAAKDELQNELNLRQGVLEFIDTQKVLTREQADKIRTLSVKPNATAADKAELDRVKEQVKADAKKFNDLMLKPNISDAERTQLTDFNQRKQQMEQLLPQWHQAFTNELADMEERKMSELGRKAREVIQNLGKKEGYSVVFPTSVALYGANDVTDAAIKALDAAK